MWRSRATTDLGPWFGESFVRAHLGGMETVTANLMEQPGPIVTSVVFGHLHVPLASVDGDSATINGAAIEYTTHFAPGSWNEEHVAGTTMCIFELRRVDTRWLVEDETCNVSGG